MSLHRTICDQQHLIGQIEAVAIGGEENTAVAVRAMSQWRGPAP